MSLMAFWFQGRAIATGGVVLVPGQSHTGNQTGDFFSAQEAFVKCEEEDWRWERGIYILLGPLSGEETRRDGGS